MERIALARVTGERINPADGVERAEVAGGSLIAASRSAQLSPEEFRAVFEEFLAK